MTTNIFEIASRKAFRFASSKGYITTEQLWDLPLTSTGRLNLDEVAKLVNAELKGVTEESFVTTAASNPAKAELETKLEVVKHIIAVRLAENEEKRVKAEKAATKAKLVDALARKQDAALENLSEEEIRAQLASL